MLALFYTEGSASAFCLGPARGFKSELESCIQYVSEGENANFHLLSLLGEIYATSTCTASWQQ